MEVKGEGGRETAFHAVALSPFDVLILGAHPLDRHAFARMLPLRPTLKRRTNASAGIPLAEDQRADPLLTTLRRLLPYR